MEIVLQIILLLIILIILKDTKLGLAIYLGYTFLVPYCQLGFGNIVLKQNLINTIVLMSVWSRTWKLDLKPFYAFLVFYGLIMFAIPFTDGVNYSFQIDRWRSGVMLNLFVPIAIWNLHFMKDAYSLFRNLLISTIIIVCIYGIFLTTTKGINPYAMFFYAISGNEYRFDWFASDDRLFGRISSVFVHPMSFAMFLGCSTVYVYSIRKHLNKYLLYSMLTLLSTNIILCGVRSILYAGLITLLYFFVFCRNFKSVIGLLLFLTILYVIIHLTPELNHYFLDVTDISDQSNIEGSSLDMRLSQLKGCLKEVHDCFFFGKGHMWHEDYIMKYYTHPTILAFESLLFIIICDYGLFGVFIYGIMTIMLLYTQKRYIKNRNERLILTCYILFYYSYCILTGDYAYMKIWLIFYYLTFSEMFLSQENKKSNNERTADLDRQHKRAAIGLHMQ